MRNGGCLAKVLPYSQICPEGGLLLKRTDLAKSCSDVKMSLVKTEVLTDLHHGGSLVFKVAVDAPVPVLYSYLAPNDLNVQVGQVVRVPLKGRELLGYVMNQEPDGVERSFKLKHISQVVVPEPLFGPELAKLIEFISGYYLYPPGLCVKEILPGGLSPKLKISYRLTEEGFKSFREHHGAEAGPGAGAEVKSLEKLAEAYPGAVPYEELSEVRRGLSEQVKNGLAEAVYKIDERGKGFSYEFYLSATPVTEEKPKRLGTKEKELYNLVKGAPPTPLSHYREIMATNPLVQAKSLAKKGLLVIERRERFRDDPSRALTCPPPNIESLTQDQVLALEAVGQALDKGEQKGFLLFGVTGSGKTEVYLRATEKALAAGRGVLWMTPEIALTMGLEGRLRERFPDLPYSILHSALTSGQRHDHWIALRRGVSRLAMGARSAIFAPISNLGLVIVDEEHDWAYKQDDGLRYQGRDLAAWRAREAGAVLILGSATPSLESYHRSQDGRLTLLRLHGRPGRAVMPEVKIIDLRDESRKFDPIGSQLKVSLRETFDRGEQALMFINRRGLAHIPMCMSCGEVMKCPHCSLSLTLHTNFDKLSRLSRDEGEDSNEAETPVAAKLESDNLLVCHGCGYRATPPKKCPKCNSPMFRYLGVGTESLIRDMEKRFGKKGLRLDTDSTRLKGGLKSILESFSNGEADFLVGTQMASKGHDFSNLTLVGVVEADMGLNMPDFRAAERTFQLLSQVSGRAGRRERPGKVFIQTRIPSHYAMTSARDHDYGTFFENEIAIRQELGYPPFARLALIRFIGSEDRLVENIAMKAAERGRELLGSKPASEIEVLGPAPCPKIKLREKYRHQIMVRAARSEDRHRLLRAWLPEVRKSLSHGVIIIVDVDPYNMM
jgi:primosomal protein N' (replication factor Y)